jgi:hypothetical protein
MEKEVIHELVGLIRSFNEHLAQQMPLLEDEIDGLISSGETDNNTIENYHVSALLHTCPPFSLSGDSIFQKSPSLFNILFYNGIKVDNVVGWACGSGDFQSLYL